LGAKKKGREVPWQVRVFPIQPRVFETLWRDRRKKGCSKIKKHCSNRTVREKVKLKKKPPVQRVSQRPRKVENKGRSFKPVLSRSGGESGSKSLSAGSKPMEWRGTNTSRSMRFVAGRNPDLKERLVTMSVHRPLVGVPQGKNNGQKRKGKRSTRPTF